MANKKTKSRVFLLLGLFVVALVVGNGVLFGMIDNEGGGGGTASPVLITDIASLDISIAGTLVAIEYGNTYIIDTVGTSTYDLYMRITLKDGKSWPDEMRVDLVIQTGQILSSHDISTLGYSEFYEIRAGRFDTSACPTGIWGAEFVFSGGWNGGTADIISPLGGKSIPFVLQKTGVTKPDPVTVNCITADYTMAPYTYYDITWEWTYAGPVTGRIVDTTNGAPPTVLQEVNLGGTTIKQQFTYSYYGRYSGEHFISFQVTPTDASQNIMVEDSCRVVVQVGGDVPEFSPTIERVDITITAKVYETGIQQDFTWSMFSEVPDWSLSQTAVDGMFNIIVVVTPADAMTACEVVIDDETIHPLTRNGDVWTVAINTDVLTQGIHHLTVKGIDRANQVKYVLGEFDISVRQAQVSPFIFIGASVAVGAVVLFMVLRRRK